MDILYVSVFIHVMFTFAVFSFEERLNVSCKGMLWRTVWNYTKDKLSSLSNYLRYYMLAILIWIFSPVSLILLYL